MCVQEEEKLLMEEDKRVNLTTFEKNKRNQVNQKEIFLLIKTGCPKIKNWLEKKGTSFAFIYYESNIVNVNHTIWWIDSSSMIHVSNILQGMENLRRSMRNK